MGGTHPVTSSGTPNRRSRSTSGWGRSANESYSDGRSWRPISMTSSNPAEVTSAVLAPRRSSRRVGGHRGAVQEPIAPAHPPGAGDHSDALVLRCRRLLPGGDLRPVPAHQVGEGPPDVDPEDCRHGRYDRPVPVTIEATPNPNALKFVVGVDVGGPKTFVPAAGTDDPLATALMALPGVASVFMSADFVTLSKMPDADWGEIAEPARLLLEEHFPNA